MKSKSGFTFVELLIVIAIIAILAAIGIVSYGHIRRTAYDAKVDSMLNQAEKAIISFNTKNTPPLDNSWNILAEMKRQGYVDDRFLQQLNDFAPIRRYGGSYATYNNPLVVEWCGNKKYLIYADSYSGGLSESELKTKAVNCQNSKCSFLNRPVCSTGIYETGKERHYRVKEIDLKD